MIICLLTSIYTARRFLFIEGFNIHLNDERVLMKKINRKELRTQYEASIYLKDIKDILKRLLIREKAMVGKSAMIFLEMVIELFCCETYVFIEDI